MWWSTSGLMAGLGDLGVFQPEWLNVWLNFESCSVRMELFFQYQGKVPCHPPALWFAPSGAHHLNPGPHGAEPLEAIYWALQVPGPFQGMAFWRNPDWGMNMKCNSQSSVWLFACRLQNVTLLLGHDFIYLFFFFAQDGIMWDTFIDLDYKAPTVTAGFRAAEWQ